MQDKENEEIEEKILDIKGTLENFMQEEMPELSQEEAIKAYKGENVPYSKKRKKTSSSSDEEETEDEEHLKRLKKELLESLERVNILAKKIFDEKSKENLRGIKVKSNAQKAKNREQIMQQMREKIEQDKERSREE